MSDGNHKAHNTSSRMEEDETNNRLSDSEFVTLTMMTRSTSPTLPASSCYVRNRRAEIDVVHQKEVTRSRKLPDTTDGEAQCDRMEETSRFARYGGNNRISCAPWSTYLDKYSSSGTSVGSPSMYSSRGFNNANPSSSRFNSFAFTRTNEAPVTIRNESTTKESSSSSQETHNSSNRSQNEKVPSDLKCTTSNENLTSKDSNASSNAQNIHGTNKEMNESRIRGNEQCSCGGRKTEASGNPSGFADGSRIFNQNVAFHRKDDSVEDSQESNGGREDWSSRQSSVPRCDEYNQRKPSIPRVGRSSPKTDTKISKCSSKTEIISSKAYCERRGSTPKSDTSSSSKTEESLRIVEGHCPNEEIISQKHDTSQRKDSTSRYVNLLSNEIIIYIIYEQLHMREADIYFIHFFVKNLKQIDCTFNLF